MTNPADSRAELSTAQFDLWNLNSENVVDAIIIASAEYEPPTNEIIFGQDTKGMWWMPWRMEPMKDVACLR